MTDGYEQDPGQVPELLTQYLGRLETVVAEGIYDRAGVYEAIQTHSPEAIIVIPPRKDAVTSGNADDLKSQRDGHIEYRPFKHYIA